MFPEINLFGRILPTYSLLAATGGGCAFLLVYYNRKKREIVPKKLYIMIAWLVFGMLLGGNLLYQLVYIKTIIYMLENAELFGGFLAVIKALLGGSIFYGGLTGAVLAALIYLKATKQPVGEYFDLLAPAIPLFHAFGRIGCFMAGCCYGVVCDVGYVYTSSPVELANGVKRFPVQLLESALCLVIFFILLILMRKNIFRRRLIWIYFLCYSVVRFFTEFLRGDDYRGVYGMFSLSQWISIAYFTVALVYVLCCFVKNQRKDHGYNK